ncbi:protein TRM32-like [Raphanus sativus]|uniref:Protein TRM32-like n=3 Tax=Raphanus sativus TaxID=3726 RepID=A0A9W3DDJ5_RAPSA|nr:protein TRM32-like [Raphanus sativus]
MGKHMKSESSSPRHGYNHKPGWLAGMLHVFDFHRWRTKNRPICWKTPRTHSLVYEANEQEPFLVSKIDSAEKPTRQLKKMMTTKQVTEYVDFLEILRKEDVSVKILKDPNSEFRKQVHIKSSPRVLPKSGSFPLSRLSSPARIEHKLKENWYAPKQKDTVLTLTVPSESSQGNKPISPSHHGAADDHGFNHAVINGFREIKKMLKNVLRDRKQTKKSKKHTSGSKDGYYHLLEQSFGRKGGDLRSKSLKLSYEEKKSQLRDDNKPQFFRRVSSLSSLEVLGSFLTEPPRDSSTRKSVDSNLGTKESLLLSESPVITENELEKDKEQEERNQENQVDCLSQSILQQEQDSVPSSLDNTAQRTESLLSQGLGLSSLEIDNHEEEDEDAYFCYVKNVLKLSGFLENVYDGEKWHSEEQPLDPSLLYQVDMQEEKEVNKEILFDLVNEAIIETHNQSHIYFPKTFSFAYPNEKRFLDEVWGRVEWSLSGIGAENRDCSLDDIVGRDLTKGDGWMNLRGDTEWLTLELEDLIFDEVLDEMICVY